MVIAIFMILQSAEPATISVKLKRMILVFKQRPVV
jgi:hypothetical protein